MTSYEQSSDEDLMLAFQKGDERAFSILVERYQVRIFNYIYRYTYDAERSEEIAQEVFIRVFRSRDRYQVSAKFATFIYRIALNLAFNEVRNRKRRRTDTVDEFYTLADREMESPHELVDRSEVESAIWREINQLPEKYYDVVLLCDVEELSYKEAGEVLGISVGTVQSRLSRGRQRLREKLGYLMKDQGETKK